MSRDMAAQWVTANCPHEPVRRQIDRFLESTFARGVDCSIHLGEQLNASGQAILLHVFPDQLLLLPLDRRQAALLKIGPNMLTCAESGRKSDCPEEAQVVLHQLKIEELKHRRSSDPIRGTFRYKSSLPPGTPTVLRSSCELPGVGSITSYAYFESPLQREGTVDFELPSLAPPDRPKFAGLASMFFRVCALPHPKSPAGRAPLSNVVAALVECV